MLVITPATGAPRQLSLDPAVNYTGAYFHLTREAAGTGTLLTVDGTPCFCSGTMIRTDHGNVPVETLRIGDGVLTASGGTQPVVWLGRRRVGFSSTFASRQARPIRIAADTFGQGRPERDLFVSPEHALFVDGSLIPARCMIGCTGVSADAMLDDTVYYHIELPRHDVVLAEGLPCESWLDLGNRTMFDNAASTPPAMQQPPSRVRYAPLVQAGPALEAARNRLGARSVRNAHIGVVGRHEVEIEPGTSSVRLVCPPGQAPGDARILGAAISAVWLDGDPMPLTDKRLGHGFHPVESTWRWTDGAAFLDLGESEPWHMLVIDVVALARPLVAAI